MAKEFMMALLVYVQACIALLACTGWHSVQREKK
jgi:hypothetical protein